ncbi:MAG TPA: DUF748 domain-containing protein [Ideonella sp.]|uniref:DUF748 domain-containing protein n=1 Tax=Ideonella sp. TaxID=1929293 RepID=UPI002E301F3E|nr:DUF748 domain-containing protein [Ideonella sp.]HEX5686447.1 DUF748 domain-containing protein [Ideonella sp.]
MALLTRGRRWLVGWGAAVALTLLLAWLILPLWLRGFAQERASLLLGRSVIIEALHINPLTLTVSVDGLVIGGPPKASTAPASPLFRLAHGELNVELRSLWRRAPVVGAIELQSPELNVARLADGRYDIDDLLTRFNPPTGPDKEPQRFALYNLRISDGHIRFDDRPKARVHEVTQIELGVPFLSNLEDAVDVKVEPHLSFRADDTNFDTGAQATLFAPERAGVFMLKTGDIDLGDWLPYLPAGLPLRPVAGAVALDLTLQFKAPAGGSLDVSLRGGVRAKSIRLEDAAHAPLAELGELALQIADVQPLRRQASLSAVDVDGLVLHAGRDGRGRLSLPSSGAPAAGVEAAAAPPWQVALAKLVVRNSEVRWHDVSVQPKAQWAAESLQLQLDNLRWPPTEGAPPARLSASATLSNAAAAPSAAASAPQWQLDGEWTATGGQLRARGHAWPLAWAAPYINQRLKPRLDGRLGFEATAKWQGEPGAQPPVLQVSGLQVDDFAATEPGEREASAAWKQLRLTDMVIDPAQHRVALGRLAWDQPVLRARRDAAGEIDLAQWWAATSSEAPADAPASVPWQVRLQEAAVDGGKLSWQDAAMPNTEPVALDLQRLKLNAQALQWPATAGSTSRWQLSVQVPVAGSGAPAGTLSFQGDIGFAPVTWRGTASLVRFPLQAVAPFAGASLPVAVGRADAGWAGQVSGGWAPDGLSLALKGEGRLTDLRLYPRGAAGVGADELLSWQSLELPGMQVALSPGKRPRVELGEARLTDFYAQLMVNEAGRFNLTDLNAAPARAQALPTAAPAAPASAAEQPEFPIDLIVAGVQLKNGRVDFSDHFVRPNYSAALSDLQGKLGGFRSGSREMATLDLSGRVAGTAPLEVHGALNPTARPPAMDVQARASDLELVPLSPYAGKYAGYAIERGKLTMDVSYQIGADGRLDAANQIVLNQLTFGERIDSPDATKLPVQLAVALLKDRDGVINLNLPIGGSLNDPEFSIGGVVLKLVGNLLAKAVTAPFALLSGGGGEDLSVVEFQPGGTRLADTAAPVLDKVAKALTERPGLRLTVTASADLQGEREAMQAAWLDERLTAELHKDKPRAGEPHTADAALPAVLPPGERERLVRRLYSDAKLPNKPRNLVGLAKDIPVPEMEALLRASHVVSADNARQLAMQRGLAVRDALIAKGLPDERLFLAAPKLQPAGEDDRHGTPHVQLGLGTH